MREKHINLIALIIVIALFLVSCGGGGGGGKTTIVTVKHWTKTYPELGEEGVAVQQTSDGGYIFLAEMNNGQNVNLIKSDLDGNILWNKVFSGSINPTLSGRYANPLQQTVDGGYIFVGSKYIDQSKGLDIDVVKTDASGNTIWEKTFGRSDDDIGHSIIETADSGYIIIGSTGYFGSRVRSQIHIIKTDSEGNSQWEKLLDNNNNVSIDDGVWIQQTKDGGYIILGTREDTITWSLYLIKIDSGGNTVWTKVFSKPDYLYATSVQETGNGYAILGKRESFVGSLLTVSDKGYSIITDQNGNALSEMTFSGGNGVEIASVIAVENGFIIMGSKEFDGVRQGDIRLEKVNSHGDTLWIKTYGGPGFQWGDSIQETADGGFIIGGGTQPHSFYLVKTDKNGNI